MFLCFVTIGFICGALENNGSKQVCGYNSVNIEREETAQEKNPRKEYIDVKVTAYDLSIQSCGKTEDHPAYGITANGTNIIDKDWKEARTIAVDPNIISLGTKVYVEFTNKNYKKYNGIYTANDTGSAIKGNHIDFFLGDFDSHKAAPEAMKFGVTQAKILILKKS